MVMTYTPEQLARMSDLTFKVVWLNHSHKDGCCAVCRESYNRPRKFTKDGGYSNYPLNMNSHMERVSPL